MTTFVRFVSVQILVHHYSNFGFFFIFTIGKLHGLHLSGISQTIFNALHFSPTLPYFLHLLIPLASHTYTSVHSHSMLSSFHKSLSSHKTYLFIILSLFHHPHFGSLFLNVSVVTKKGKKKKYLWAQSCILQHNTYSLGWEEIEEEILPTFALQRCMFLYLHRDIHCALEHLTVWADLITKSVVTTFSHLSD